MTISCTFVLHSQLSSLVGCINCISLLCVCDICNGSKVKSFLIWWDLADQAKQLEAEQKKRKKRKDKPCRSAFSWLWRHAAAAAAAAVILRSPLRCNAKPWMDMHMTGRAELGEQVALHEPSVKSTTTSRRVSNRHPSKRWGLNQALVSFYPAPQPPSAASLDPSIPAVRKPAKYSSSNQFNPVKTQEAGRNNEL